MKHSAELRWKRRNAAKAHSECSSYFKIGFFVYIESKFTHLLLRCGRISSEPGCGTSAQFSQIVFRSIRICVCFFMTCITYYVSCFDVVAVVIVVVVVC